MSRPYQCRGYLFIVRNLLKLSIQQIADECGVCYTTISDWLGRSERMKKSQILCKFCGEPIRFHKIECISKIINIQQPKVLYFCQKECKLNFIGNVQKEVKTIKGQ